MEKNSDITKPRYREHICAPPPGFSLKTWVGVCGPFPKTLIPNMTKICDIPYTIYDLTKYSIPYLKPDQ